MSTGIDAQVMTLSPRLKALIDGMQKLNVMGIVLAHDDPRFIAALDAFSPKVRATVLDLAPASDIAAYVIQFVAIKFEGAAGKLKRVYCFEWRWGWKTVDCQSSIDLLYVKRIAVMRDNNVGAVKNAKKVAD